MIAANPIRFQLRRRGLPTVRWAAVALLVAAWASVATAAERKVWTISPYRVHVLVAVDSSARPQPQLETTLTAGLAERVESTMGPLWQAEFHPAADAAERRRCFAPAEIPWEELPSGLKSFDKLLSLGITATASGHTVVCREFDVYLRRWGPLLRREIAQVAYLREGALAALCDCFSPLATVESIPDNDAQVRLDFKGAGLPGRAAELFAAPGDAYQPLVRRTDRTGEVMKNGIGPVPWTYLTAAEATDEGWLADVHSGIRRPFGMQRRGFVHQVAVRMRTPPEATTVRFHARSDPNQGLAGYEVFRTGEGKSPELIGRTGRQGEITIPPGAGAISMVLLRSEGQLLAKVPVLAGVAGVVETPIADNAARLRATAEAQAVREELVDVVARRAVMMARTRALLKQGRVDDARELMTALDALPSVTTFSRNIDAAAKRLPPSDDPAVQQTIEKLFTTTRELLTKFLSPRAIVELQGEVNAAATPATPGG